MYIHIFIFAYKQRSVRYIYRGVGFGGLPNGGWVVADTYKNRIQMFNANGVLRG